MTRGGRQLKCAVIGAGMAGILSAVRLAEAGIEDFTVYEKADGIGGTWRENTYPGLSCDVPSQLYSYSFAPSPDWSRHFSPGAEIQAYLERVADDEGVTEHVRLGDEVISCLFDDGRWKIETASGFRDDVDFVIAATGVLHHPRIPDIEGIEEFGGSLFHSARWDHSARLDGARVGIVGTGSTSVQIVSAIVDRVSKLSLFQRTAQWVLQQPNPEYSDDERSEFREHPELLAENRRQLAEIFEIFSIAVVDAESDATKFIEQACAANLENVEDPDLRERLRPDYRAACKRLVISPDFYGAIQRPNAELVTERIQRIEHNGVRTADGRLHELDVLVLATGFKTDAFMRPMRVVGRNGLTLEEAWNPRPVAYLSISIPDFPNFFMLNGPNGPVGNFSLIEVAELQLSYILQLVERIRSGKSREVSATQRALDDFEEARAVASGRTVWVTGCKSWYLDDRGLPAVWPWPFGKFRERMASPDPDAYELI
jgi:cation diffusion facilitator CzcD-associated flavoprotein CzcO